MSGRTDSIPKDTQAEQAILASVLIDPTVIGDVLALVGPRDFLDVEHRHVMQGMVDLRGEGRPAGDPALVRSKLAAAGVENPAGLLASILESTPTAAHVKHYASIVREAADKRRIIEMAGDMQTAAMNGKSSGEIFADLRAGLDDLQRDGAGLSYQRITSAELDAAEYEIEYLVEFILVAGQPCILAGGKKTLKTSLLIDLAVALAVGGFFLGKLRVTRACRVLMMSGESGLPTLQETARRIADEAGHELGDLSNLIWSPDLPKFGDVAHLEAFEQFLTANEIEVVMLDPAYMCLPGDDAGNLFKQGELLRGMSEVCQRVGATMILAHHTRKNVADPFAPPELESIAWAGFQEFARQWILVGRREKYEPGSGVHRLWLNCGGSAGHSALWGVDIEEGVYDGVSERYWHVDTMKADDVREDHERRQEDNRVERERERLQRNLKAILAAIVKCDDQRGTKSDIRERSGLSGTNFNTAWGELLRTNEVAEAEMVKKENGHSYQTYGLGHSD